MKKITVNLLTMLLILVCAPCVYAHTANIFVPENVPEEYVSVPLSADMYPACRADFGDIRIYDSSGNAVPYFIQQLGGGKSETNEHSYRMIVSDSFVKNGYLYTDFALTEEYPNDIRASSLRLSASADNFAKSARLLGSYDGLEWTPVQEGNIYSVEDSRRLTFNFSEPKKFTHYRVGVSDGGENPHFIGAVLHFHEEIPERLRFTSEIQAEYTKEESDGRTVIGIPSIRNMRVESIEIETDDMFRREVSYPGGTRTLQRLTFGGETISDTRLDLRGMTIPANFSISVYNGDSPPLDIKGIKVSYYENYIIFRASSSEYRTEFGNAELSAPLYDIENYKNEVVKRPLAFLEFSDIVIDDTPPEKANMRLIFNISVCAAAAALIILLASALKRQ